MGLEQVKPERAVLRVLARAQVAGEVATAAALVAQMPDQAELALVLAAAGLAAQVLARRGLDQQDGRRLEGYLVARAGHDLDGRRLDWNVVCNGNRERRGLRRGFCSPSARSGVC